MKISNEDRDKLLDHVKEFAPDEPEVIEGTEVGDDISASEWHAVLGSIDRVHFLRSVSCLITTNKANNSIEIEFNFIPILQPIHAVRVTIYRQGHALFSSPADVVIRIGELVTVKTELPQVFLNQTKP